MLTNTFIDVEIVDKNAREEFKENIREISVDIKRYNI